MKQMRRAVILISMAAIAAIARPAVAAGGYTVVFMMGDVKIVSGGEARAAVRGQPLGGGETVVTGANSMADLLVGRGAYMRIQEKSRVSLASLNKSKDDPDLSMDSGRVLVIMSKLAKGSGYEVKTDTHVASVRGTVFQVSESGQESQLDVLFGSVRVNPVIEGVVQRQIAETVGENQSLTLTRSIVRDVLAKKKRMSLSELRREVRESMMRHMAQVRESPEFKTLSENLKREIDSRIEKAKQDLIDRKLDRKSVEERIRQEQERVKEELRRRKEEMQR